jgi:short-subunit dehydrogenase
MPEVVAITGASAGVGRTTAAEFARHGAHIGLIARGVERLAAAQAEVETLGGKALFVPTDVANSVQVERAADTIEQAFGPIDVWVNCAMTTIFAPFTEIQPAEFKRATEVTYLGFVYGTMAALRRMKPRGHGVVVQVGSALAYRSIPLQSAYCGAKHATVGFTDSIRSELIHDRSPVHITMVHLPGMNTPQFSWCRTRLPRHPQPLGPVFQPEVAARAIYAAAHERRREIYVGGPTVKAIYGQELAPGHADRYLAEVGIDGQQTDQPVDPNRPDNLFEPAPGDWAAHGIFGERAHAVSPQNWLNLNRKPLLAGVSAMAAALVLGVLTGRSH